VAFSARLSAASRLILAFLGELELLIIFTKKRKKKSKSWISAQHLAEDLFSVEEVKM